MQGLSGVYNPIPFAEGRFRRAYKGVVTAPPTSKGKELVIKKPKDLCYAHLLPQIYSDIKVAAKAQEFAARFNLESNTSTPINFQQPVRMQSYATDGSTEPILVEWYLYGSYTHWISNGGGVNQSKASEDDLLLAFAHWTWVKSGGQLLVCDLQGVKGNPDGYHLTDPAINSVTQEYGTTDLAQRGIDLFFKTHVCNSHCRSLGIETMKPQPNTQDLNAMLSLIGNRLGTTYQGEVPQLLQQIQQIQQIQLQMLHGPSTPLFVPGLHPVAPQRASPWGTPW